MFEILKESWNQDTAQTRRICTQLSSYINYFNKKNKVFSTLSLIHSFNSIGIKMIKTVTNTCTGGYMYMYFKIALKYHIQPHVCPHYSYVYSFRVL